MIVLRVILKVSLAVLVVLLLPLLLFLALVFRLCDELSDRRFRRLHDQNVYFVANRRHGWHEFVINNVVPALPPRVCVVWQEQMTGRVRERCLPRRLRVHLSFRKKPLMVLVTRKAYRVASMHERLLEWKLHAKKSAIVQEQIRMILDAARRELHAS
jgi:hypothetical protein